MPKLTQKELDALVVSSVEGLLKDAGLADVIRKLKFNGSPDPDKLSKEEKTLRFFKAQLENDRASIMKYCGGVVKDLSGNTAGSGLELLPQEFHADIIDRVAKDPLALRTKCTVVPVQYRGGTWPVGATGVTLTWESSDTNPLTATTPTFATSLSYNVSRLDGYTPIARDLLSDTPVNLYSYLVMQYAKAFTKAENTAIFNGTGTNQPTGIRNAAGVLSVAIAQSAGTNVLAPDDLVGLPFSIDVSWRSGSAYFCNTKTIKQMKLMKDTQGRYLWTNGDMTKGVPDTFNGYPVFEFTAIFPENLTVNSKSTCTECCFGNLEYYYLFDKGEMGSEINTQSDTAFKNHEALVKMWERIDGKISIPVAFVRLTGFLA
jgi:HK97 family phage major capsid protein